MRPTAPFVALVAFIWAASAHPLLKVTLDKKFGNVLCPNKKFQCPSGQTCCPTTSTSGYGCCNKSNAVCCSDGIHCCDQGTTCDVSGRVCIPAVTTTVSPQLAMLKLGSIPFWVKKPADACPGGGSCPGDDTCCPKDSSNTTYGCCPQPNAVCCNDYVHCCPSGHTCNPPYCVPSTKEMFTVVPYAAKSASTVPSLKTFGVKKPADACPGGGSCPGDDTCCPKDSSNTTYGCCPQPNAVCCNDYVHCCPSGHTCNPPYCVPSTKEMFTVVPYAAKSASTVQSLKNVICPDQQSECPDASTCCPLSDNSYGCCPRPNAVCCSDHKHCCPANHSCSGGKCVSKSRTTFPMRHLEYAFHK